MQVLFEFLPLIAFFAAFKLSGNIYVATAVIVTAVALQVAYRLIRGQKLTTLQKASAVLMLALGGLTLLLHDDRFLLWKPTGYFWLVGIGLIVGQLVSKEPPLSMLLGTEIKLARERWRTLTWVWVVFFALLGTLNLYVAFNYSRETWVNFKVFGMTGIMLVFMVLQGWWMIQHAQDGEPASLESSDKPSTP